SHRPYRPRTIPGRPPHRRRYARRQRCLGGDRLCRPLRFTLRDGQASASDWQEMNPAPKSEVPPAPQAVAAGPELPRKRPSGRGETGWLARTQGGREPQRGSMPVRSTDEDSRPTEDNARSGLKNGVPAFPDRLAWGLDTRKSPTPQDRSACLRLFETTSRRPVSPRPAPQPEPMLYCPNCSRKLEPLSCKLRCPVCGYYMSCSDYI